MFCPKLILILLIRRTLLTSMKTMEFALIFLNSGQIFSLPRREIWRRFALVRVVNHCVLVSYRTKRHL